jgi:hypothetical protein
MLGITYVEDYFKYIIYSLYRYVFYCGASKTLNPSLQVEEIHQTFRVKTRQLSSFLEINHLFLLSDAFFIYMLPCYLHILEDLFLL